MIKKAFDFTFSLFGIILSLPVWFLISLAILIEDGWPVLYSQERMGKDCRIFRTFKFRSMVKEAEKHTGPIQASEDDCRVTKVGRFLRDLAIDELPQLLNILQGDISFVGPRALRFEEREVSDNFSRKAFDYPNFQERAKIEPGLTGIAQVFAPRDISRKEKFEYDVWYIRNRSFWLDIYIIIVSFLITFRGNWGLKKSKFTLLGRRLKERIQSQLGKS
jgi:lipopolysaccharide/colanic/teichoic acid biosynthesis glycosyltransferase